LDFTCLFRFFQHVTEQPVPPVAAAATYQAKLCPYDEEEPHIWFHLIEAQFTTDDHKDSNMPMPQPDCSSRSFGTFWTPVMSATILIILLII
jgi:hypothetical protein